MVPGRGQLLVSSSPYVRLARAAARKHAPTQVCQAHRHAAQCRQPYARAVPAGRRHLLSRLQQQRSPRRAAAACQAQVLSAGMGTPAAAKVLATLTGYAVLVGSCFRSVPQIVRIVRNSSAEGVSQLAVVAELVAYSITLAYNVNLGYPFSTYGEVAACWLQDIALIWLLLRFNNRLGWQTPIQAAAFAALFLALMSGACGMQTLAVLQAATIPIIALGGRVPQILLNARRGNSGQLSLTTCALNVAGGVARIFTTLVLTRDPLILTASVVQTCLNSVLLRQTLQTLQMNSAVRPQAPAFLDSLDDGFPELAGRDVALQPSG